MWTSEQKACTLDRIEAQISDYTSNCDAGYRAASGTFVKTDAPPAFPVDDTVVGRTTVKIILNPSSNSSTSIDARPYQQSAFTTWRYVRRQPSFKKIDFDDGYRTFSLRNSNVHDDAAVMTTADGTEYLLFFDTAENAVKEALSRMLDV